MNEQETKNGELESYTPKPVNSQPATETASTALASQAKAMVEARYMMAMHNPRNMDTVRIMLLRECKRPGFADSAIYHKPVGAGVEGPSIRFAEAAIRCMTNILPECNTVFDDPERRIVRVSVTDLEANVCYTQDVTINKTVERKVLKRGESPIKTRINSQGQMLYIMEATDDDILNKQNALISKALRTLGLRLLPGDILDECMAACRKVRADETAKDPDAAKKAIYSNFATRGVMPEMLVEYLGHGLETINPKEIEELRGLLAALTDGETTWREIVDAKKEPEDSKGTTTATPKGSTSLKDALKAKQETTEAKSTTPGPAVAEGTSQGEKPQDEIPL